jgi:hypothetical protein
VGSAAGIGLALAVARPDECGSDDLSCTLEKIGIALVVSAGGAAVGDVLTGRMAETRPSTAGAVVGSLAGIVAGVGVVHLLSEELDVMIQSMMAVSNSSPPTRMLRETTIPPSEMTATSVVPPPISTTIEPAGSPIGRPAPIAAAIGSSIVYARRAPAW